MKLLEELSLAENTTVILTSDNGGFWKATQNAPTCLFAAGLKPLPNQHLDGHDLGPLMRNEQTNLNREALFWHYPHYNEHPSSVPSSVIRKGPWKLIETFDPEGVELYHLGNDSFKLFQVSLFLAGIESGKVLPILAILLIAKTLTADIPDDGIED